MRCLVGLCIVVLAIFLNRGLLLHASSAIYNPLGVIGQYTAGGGPDYTNTNPNGVATSPNATGFYGLGASVADPTHNRLFVANPGNNRVLVFPLTSSGDAASRSATLVIGQADLTSGNAPSPPSAASLHSPLGLAYDAVRNRLFVADTSNHRVLVYDLTAGITDGMSASNVLGQSDFVSDLPSTYGAPTASNLFNPSALGYDPTGQRLFVADEFNNRVLVYNLSGGITDGMSASNVLGEPDFTTISGGSSNMDTLFQPLPGLAYDTVHNRLFVTTNSYRVLIFDLSGGITNGMSATNRLGGALFGGTINQSNLHNPGGVAYDSGNNRLFVVDNYANRVIVYDLTAGITDGMSATHVLGQAAFSDHDTHLNQNGFYTPLYISYDNTSQRLWVSDNNNARLMEFNLSSGLSDNMNAADELGQTTPGGIATYTSNNAQNNQPLASSLNAPGDVLIDPTTHRMFALDTSNARILVYNLDSQNQRLSNNANFVLGQADLTSGAGLIQTNNSLGNTQTAVTPSNITYGAGMAYDSVHQRLFVAETSPVQRVMVFDLSSGIANGMNAINVLGRPDLSDNSFISSSGPATSNTIANPAGMAYDSVHQRLFVCDSGDNRVMVYDLSGGITDNMATSVVLGQPDLTSNNSNAGSTGLSSPQGVYYNPGDQSLAVADTGNNRVLFYDTSGGITNGMTASTVLGQPDFNDTASATSNVGLSGPTALTFDPDRNFFLVSDSNNNRVVGYDTTSELATGQVAALVIGQPDMTTSDPNGGQAGLNFPLGVYYDSTTAQLYVADSNNNRLMAYGTVPPTPPSSGSGSGSSTSSGNSSSGSRPTIPAIPGGASSVDDNQAGTEPAGVFTTVPPPTDLSQKSNFESEGYTTDIVPGQQFLFTPSDTSQAYTLIVGPISPTSLQMNVTPHPQEITLLPNQARSVDVDGNGNPDITLTATQLSQGHARLLFAVYRSPLLAAGSSHAARKPLNNIQRLLVDFPYLLLAILLIIIVVLLKTTIRELLATKRLRNFYQLQVGIAKQKETFIQLAAHYLRTPLTLIVASKSLLASAAASNTEMDTAIKNLGTDIEALLSEATSGDSSIVLHPILIRSTFKRPVFYIPVSLLGAAILIFYWLMHVAAVGATIANANFFIQIALLVLLGVSLYALLRSSWLYSQEQEELRNALRNQAQLDDERNAFIEDAAASLLSDVGALTVSLGELPQTKVVAPFREGIERLKKLLNRLLLVKDLRLVAAPSELQQLSLDSVWRQLEPLIEQAATRNIAVHLPENGIVWVRNTPMVAIVMQTLLDNAISYSQNDSPIEIITSRGPHGSFRISVNDHGKGILEQDAAQLFQPFTKTEGALAFNHEGVGLSLYLDQLIMAYLGGTISLHSTPNQGTGIVIDLPQK